MAETTKYVVCPVEPSKEAVLQMWLQFPRLHPALSESVAARMYRDGIKHRGPEAEAYVAVSREQLERLIEGETTPEDDVELRAILEGK